MRRRTWTIILVIVMAGTLVAGAVPLFTVDFASAQVCTSTSDFVTGGGWIRPDGTAKANFGVAGGCKNGILWGHLQYVDHGSINAIGLPTPFKVHGTEITGYDFFDPTTRVICGTATTNDNANSTVFFIVTVSDNGEGQSGGGDLFMIELFFPGDFIAFYTAGGPLGGGNIQLHKPVIFESFSCFNL
jgi:hypothetical protein